ncbi:hypothetical protein AAHA92_10088 [Salvia divinorum]|uniref:Uncharacterized protein n=1 Tax=Salvia divinorum TaxID=28513 RepID=A0ABD1HV49_SALDI
MGSLAYCEWLNTIPSSHSIKLRNCKEPSNPAAASKRFEFRSLWRSSRKSDCVIAIMMLTLIMTAPEKLCISVQELFGVFGEMAYIHKILIVMCLN